MRDEEKEYKQSDLLYDYIKFHLGLYIATPTAFVIIGKGIGLNNCESFNYAFTYWKSFRMSSNNEYLQIGIV